MWSSVFTDWVMVCMSGRRGGIDGVYGKVWYLGMWGWWRRDLIWRMVWGVKVILMREGMVWIGRGCLGDWTGDGVWRSGWEEIVGREVVGGRGCDWGVGVGSGGVQSGRVCVLFDTLGVWTSSVEVLRFLQ